MAGWGETMRPNRARCDANARHFPARQRAAVAPTRTRQPRISMHRASRPRAPSVAYRTQGTMGRGRSSGAQRRNVRCRTDVSRAACQPDLPACSLPKEGVVSAATTPIHGLADVSRPGKAGVHSLAGWTSARPVHRAYPRGSRLLARKRFFVLPAKPRRAKGTTPSPASKLPLRAHPRLVLGFLVRVVKSSPGTAAPTSGTQRRARSAPAGLRVPADAKHEGPPDDATFH